MNTRNTAEVARRLETGLRQSIRSQETGGAASNLSRAALTGAPEVQELFCRIMANISLLRARITV
jgi:hypothetical protein